jgi:hypothetical protein
MATHTYTPPPIDHESDIAAWTVGSGMVFIQLCALFPGLLPTFLLLLPLALPVLVIGVVVGIPYLLFRGAWRLASSAATAIRPHTDIETREALRHA